MYIVVQSARLPNSTVATMTDPAQDPQALKIPVNTPVGSSGAVAPSSNDSSNLSDISDASLLSQSTSGSSSSSASAAVDQSLRDEQAVAPADLSAVAGAVDQLLASVDSEAASEGPAVSAVEVETEVPTEPANTATIEVPPAPLGAEPVAAAAVQQPATSTVSTPATHTQAPVAAGDKPNSVLDILLTNGSLSQEAFNQVTVEHISTGTPIESLLFDKKFASEEAIVRAKAEFNNIPFIKIADTGSDPQALTQLPESVARTYKMLPISYDKAQNHMVVAMINPLDLAAIDFAEKKSGVRIEAKYATPSELERTLAEHYSQSLSSEVTEALQQTSQVNQAKQQKQSFSELSGETIRQAPITKIVHTIVEFAMKALASDIHIEPQEGRTRVRYRIDGILQEKLILPSSVHDAVVSRVKILSNLKIDEKRVPQDGRFNFSNADQEVDLRVSTLPTIHGEKIVMRLLKKDQSVPDLPQLGLDGLALKNLSTAIKVPHGIVLVTGPTGSGKTTTLYSVLHKVNSPRVNIVTLEDPVEYQMVGVNQVQINPQAGLSFASGLRSFLRQDPNVIMVGEIRDSETAELAVQAALTGHLVFSTLHTSSAAGALPRLLDMGAEPFLLASSITLVMAQRVLRKINEAYKEEYKPEKAVLDDIINVLGPRFDQWCKTNNKKPEDIVLYRAKKERPPTEPEYRGRIAIFEVMPISESISKMILEQRPSSDMEKQAMTEGMLLMKQDGYLKVLNGVTSIEEVVRVAQI